MPEQPPNNPGADEQARAARLEGGRARRVNQQRLTEVPDAQNQAAKANRSLGFRTRAAKKTGQVSGTASRSERLARMRGLAKGGQAGIPMRSTAGRRGAAAQAAGKGKTAGAKSARPKMGAKATAGRAGGKMGAVTSRVGGKAGAKMQAAKNIANAKDTAKDFIKLGKMLRWRGIFAAIGSFAWWSCAPLIPWNAHKLYCDKELAVLAKKAANTPLGPLDAVPWIRIAKILGRNADLVLAAEWMLVMTLNLVGFMLVLAIVTLIVAVQNCTSGIIEAAQCSGII